MDFKLLMMTDSSPTCLPISNISRVLYILYILHEHVGVVLRNTDDPIPPSAVMCSENPRIKVTLTE